MSIKCSLTTLHRTSVDTSILELRSAALEKPLGVALSGAGSDRLKMFFLFIHGMSGS